MSLSSGAVVGQYRIARKLGSGGMGEVYQATHIVLRREVALKTVRSDVTGSASRCNWLIQEARAASLLDHPHIATIYDVTEVNGSAYIAMEYVEGQNLRQALAHGPPRMKEALRYAVQIAGALGAAHDAGLLHGDVKPGNIMITQKNVIKVVDFGLAGMTEPLEATAGEDAPTRTMRVDRHSDRDDGLVSGTVGYMSPEQIRGSRLDARSDIFSFGIVLYEMLTGVAPFAGPSDLAVTSKILDGEPCPARELAPDVPEEVEELIRFCLRKDRDNRARSMHDVGHVLQVALLATERRRALKASDGRPWRWLIPAGAMLVLLAGWAVGAFLASRETTVQHGGSLRRITWDGGLSEKPTLSADGRLLAFASDRAGDKHLDIFVRRLGEGEPVRLTYNPAGDTDPSLSADGGLVAFHSNRGGVYVVPSLGGQERLVAAIGNNPRFSPDGKWIAYWTGEATNISPSARTYIVSASGGTPKQLQPSFADARYPVWTPDGAHILFQGVDVWNSSTSPHPDWWVASSEGGKAVETGAWTAIEHAGFPTVYPPGGWYRDKVVFSARNDAARSLLAIPVSSRNWQVQGPPEPLTFGTGIDGYPYPAPSGSVAFTSYQYEINIWSRKLDKSGHVRAEEARKLTTGSAYHTSGSLSADGARLVFLLGHSPGVNVWVRDVATARETAITVDEKDKCSAVLSAKGTRVAWSMCGPGEAIYMAAISPDLSIPVAEEVCGSCGRVTDWSRDGNSILFVDQSHPVKTGIISLSSRAKITISSPRYNLERAKFSPDGNWIALRAEEPHRGDRARLFAIPLRAGKPAPETEWVALTTGEFWDDNPVWSERGDALLFYSRRDGFGCIWRQPVNEKTKLPYGDPAEVIPLHNDRLSINELTGSIPSLWLMNNQLLFNALERTGSIWVLEGGFGAVRKSD